MSFNRSKNKHLIKKLQFSSWVNFWADSGLFDYVLNLIFDKFVRICFLSISILGLNSFIEFISNIVNKLIVFINLNDLLFKLKFGYTIFFLYFSISIFCSIFCLLILI